MTRGRGHLLAGLVLAAVGALGMAWMMRVQARAAATAVAQDRLSRVGAVATDQRGSALERLRLRGTELASDPAFVDYVVQSMQPGAAAGGGIDQASIRDLLASRRAGYDLLAVLDPQGRPVAFDGDLPLAEASVAMNPLVKRTIAMGKPEAGAWALPGRLLWVSVHPLERGGIVQGLLLTASGVGDDYAARVSGQTGVAVAVLAAGDGAYSLASGHALPGWASSVLPQVAAGLTAALPLSDSELHLPGDHAERARAVPLTTASGHAVLVALAAPSKGLERPLWPPLLFMLAGVLMVGWQWWCTRRPAQC